MKLESVELIKNISSDYFVGLTTKTKKLEFTKNLCEVYRVDLEQIFKKIFKKCISVKINIKFNGSFEDELSIIKKYVMILLYLYTENKYKHNDLKEDIIFMMEYLKNNIVHNINIRGDLLCEDMHLIKFIKKMNYKIEYINEYSDNIIICVGAKIDRKFKMDNNLINKKYKTRLYRNTFCEQLIDYCNDQDIYLLNKKIFNKIKEEI